MFLSLFSPTPSFTVHTVGNTVAAAVVWQIMSTKVGHGRLSIPGSYRNSKSYKSYNTCSPLYVSYSIVLCRRARGRIDPDLDNPDPDSPHRPPTEQISQTLCFTAAADPP